ncbi:hypothetical protein DL766_009604 [Monosporascus sp. MC13-8B]|uniref:DUF7730 domain-containing protein n=1 Tax=Monosporascus cannonballus TaxID=155416 RepID=A0ABY0H7L1_9PEZI|nr:hypothetical protein DL762_004512 [Monosporascus cannonballus]RYO94718.1 hypothetical protein DL763_003992 [Monosporascus cannonballus]RYP14702.1 hypothetical protein DL766_009604 [Monosporascus sp. MC13-8B]
MASLVRRILGAVVRSAHIHHFGSELDAAFPTSTVKDYGEGRERTPLSEPIPAGQLAETAHHQFQSDFFGKLPLEIRRQIYEELWRSAGESQHIFHMSGRLRRCVCITDHDAEDERDDIVENFKLEKSLTHETYFSNPALHRQLSSTWTKHWKCEEHMAKHGANEPAPFLPALTTCKRMYFECMDSIGEHVTLNFTSLQAAHDFAVIRRRAPIVSTIRRFNFSFYLSQQEIDKYMPWNDSQWKQLWQTLGGLENVRQVKLWLDGRLGSDQHGLQLNGPALFKCLDEAPKYRLSVNLPTDEDAEEKLIDPWGPRYAMDCFQGVELQFRGAPAYRPSDKKGVCGPTNSAMPSLEVMAWYSMSMNV